MKTAKELAKALGVSTQTVRNEATNQNIVSTRQGKFFYFVDDDAERIKEAILERQNDKETKKRGERSNQQSDYIALLLKEIASKDKQIELLQGEKAALSQQLTTAQETLKDVTESLKAAQVIAQTATLRIAQHDERSWWQRLFGIRKKADGDQGEV